MQRVSINENKEKRAIFNNIKMIGINEDGIVYGGMVRDEIIATHYKSLFDGFVKPMTNKPYEKFWNKNFHRESIKRLLIPEDMDIYFKNNDHANEFIQKITSYASEFNGHLNIHNVARTSGLSYIQGDNFAHKIVRITFRLGRTCTFIGYKVDVKIDIIINLTEQDLEPPFNCADFTSNIFVMAKTSPANYEIRLSKNTGTPLDTMPFVLKRRAEMQIIENMIAGKIEFIRNVESVSAECINGMRILKMMTKTSHLYQITNLLFREITIAHCEQQCDICLETINDGMIGTFIEITTNKHACNVMHKNCFISYLTKEIATRHRNEAGNIECRCTRRNAFNFKESYRYSALYK
jgi:hypothetical protein